jgi:hypothetical protein
MPHPCILGLVKVAGPLKHLGSGFLIREGRDCQTELRLKVVSTEARAEGSGAVLRLCNMRPRASGTSRRRHHPL